MPTEAELRTELAKRLELIEPRLSLIGEEHFLANAQGSSGRIDILARSTADQSYVVIELKRSNQASRQALHELEKYVPLLRANYGIDRRQIRCYVVSTIWHELLVPLSEFKLV